MPAAQMRRVIALDRGSAERFSVSLASSDTVVSIFDRASEEEVEVWKERRAADAVAVVGSSRYRL